MAMNRIHYIRLRALFTALIEEIDRWEWEDREALEEWGLTLNEQVDCSFDLEVGEHPCSSIDDDHPDETDHVEWPLCVECGNFSPSCVC